MSFRQALRRLKYSFSPALESLWRPLIGALSRTSGAAPERWASSGHHRVLVIAPHPDDEAIGCVGTLLRPIEAGDRVCVAIATDGRRSRAVSDPDQMARLRRAESTVAAQLMRVERIEWLGLPEGGWSIAQLSDVLRGLLLEWRPDVIYAPSRVDFHPEHFAVAHSLALALETAGAALDAATLRVYQVQVPLTATLTNLVADVTPLRALCDQVLRAYASQAVSVACAYRLRRYAAMSMAGTEWLESYWQMPAERYIELHRSSPADWPAVFRGLRTFPLSDPLGWLAGRAERRRLAALAQ